MSTKQNRKSREAALLQTKDEDVMMIDSKKRNSKKRTNSERDESKRRSTKPHSNIEPPKKKQKKEKTKNAKNFFEDEAEEGDGSDFEEEKQVAKDCEIYSKEFLRPKADRLDKSMIKDMEDKYKNDDEGSDFSEEQIKEYDPNLIKNVKNMVKQMTKGED